MTNPESTKLSSQIQLKLQQLLEEAPQLMDIVHALHQNGGRPYLVGGAVRDLLLNQTTKDIDIEVHRLTLEQVEHVLAEFGTVLSVGKSFGVLRLAHLDVDWSLPRSDQSGRKPDVTIDPHMSLCDAFSRRDFTMNAMGIDLIGNRLVDCFGGQDDLKKGILRSPNSSFFTEDPLRFFRVMQFVGRFDLHVDPALNDVCSRMDISEVSIERIESEFRKLLLKSKQPSRGFRWLREVGRLQEILPELYDTIGVPQRPDLHPEGDVFEHTMQVLDAAAREKLSDDVDRLILMYAGLCHDLGKVETTQEIEGCIRAHGHENAGVPLANNMLKRITRQKDLIDAVCTLVKYHMVPMHFIKDNVEPSAYKRLAYKIFPLTLQMLARLAMCDKQGRNPEGFKPLQTYDSDVIQFAERAAQANVLHGMEEAVLKGRDLIDHVKPGEHMGNLLRQAYHIQIEEGIQDKDALLKRVLSH